MFKLQKYFLLASAPAIIIVVVALVALYRQNALNDLVFDAHEENTVLAQAVSNALWPRFGPYIKAIKQPDRASLLTHPTGASLQTELLMMLTALPVLKAKIYSPIGITVYSTTRAQIGEDYAKKAGFIAAIGRNAAPSVLSRYSKHERFSGFSGELFNSDIVETYFAVRDSAGALQGVIELYSDETSRVTRVNQTARSLLIGLAIIFGLLYMVLNVIVRRADGILKRQYAELADSEETIRFKNSALLSQIKEREKIELALQSAHNELEGRVVERTLDLATANSKLQEEIRERVTAEKELATAKTEAEQANEAKTKFLAAASHDLRQPHQTLVLYMGLLSKLVTEPEVQEILDLMRQSMRTIQGLLRSLLDISKLDAGVVDPKIIDFSLDVLLRRMTNEFRPLAGEKHLDFRCMPTSLVVRSSAELLEGILRNLVSNAVAHTNEGRVLIGCRRHGDTVRIEVWDTGPGIPKDQIHAIFQEHVQLNQSRSSSHQGMGLGLAIVDRLARILDHPVEVRSHSGKGSVFTVDVPIGDRTRVSMASSIPAVWGANLRNALVAVIEDDENVLAAMDRSLKLWGCRVVSASSCEELLTKLPPTGTKPQLIIADYRLGNGKTGDTEVRLVQESFGSPISGIIVTGDTAPDILNKVSRGGCLLLHKPVQPEELYSAVKKLLNGAKPAGEPAATPKKVRGFAPTTTG